MGRRATPVSQIGSEFRLHPARARLLLCAASAATEKKAICGVKCLDQAHTFAREREGGRWPAIKPEIGLAQREDQWISRISWSSVFLRSVPPLPRVSAIEERTLNVDQKSILPIEVFTSDIVPKYRIYFFVKD